MKIEDLKPGQLVNLRFENGRNDEELVEEHQFITINPTGQAVFQTIPVDGTRAKRIWKATRVDGDWYYLLPFKVEVF